MKRFNPPHAWIVEVELSSPRGSKTSTRSFRGANTAWREARKAFKATRALAKHGVAVKIIVMDDRSCNTAWSKTRRTRLTPGKDFARFTGMESVLTPIGQRVLYRKWENRPDGTFRRVPAYVDHHFYSVKVRT